MLHKLLLALIITFLLPVSPALSALPRNGCVKQLPPASERVGYWKYKRVHGQRCWQGKQRHMKVRQVWRDRPAKNTERVKGPHLPAKPMGFAPAEPYNADIWPPLDETSFDARFIGERK